MDDDRRDLVMDTKRPKQNADKERAARDFVRTVLVTSFKQHADEKTISGVARKVLNELAASPVREKRQD
jgi:hypothetical protein